MIWRRFAFTGHKTHAVTADLEAPLLAEMTSRGAKLASNLGIPNPKPITDWGFDLGGGCYVGRPIEDFSWCGLSLWVPSEDVDAVIGRVAQLEVRRFATGERYMKLHHWHFCTVMTPAQVADLIVLLSARADGAAERTRLFAEAVDRAAAQGGPS